MTDLRYLRTERDIQNSFMKLLEEKDFNDLNISMLTKEALISRPTFYDHYESLFDLAERMIRKYLDMFLVPVMEADRLRKNNASENQIFQQIVGKFQKIADHRQEYIAIRKINLGSNSFDLLLKKRMIALLKPYFSVDTNKNKLALVNLSSVLMGNFEYILDTGEVPTIDEVADSILNIYHLIKD